MEIQYQNGSRADLDTANSTTLQERSENRFTYLTMELILFFLGLAAIISNFMIAYALRRLKQLEKPRGFVLLVLLLYSTVYLIFSPVDRYLLKHLSNKSILYTQGMCFVYEVINCSMFLVTCLHAFLCIDWILCNFFFSKYIIYEKKRTVIEILLLCTCFLVNFYTMASCVFEFNNFTAHYCLYFYFHLIFVSVLHITKIICNKKSSPHLNSDYVLVLPTVFVVFWCPHFIIETLSNYFEDIFSDFVIFLVSLMEQSSFIFNIVYFSKCHSEFDDIFNDIVKCDIGINR